MINNNTTIPKFIVFIQAFLSFCIALINSASAQDASSNNTYISSNPNITNSQIIRAAGDHNYPPYEFIDPSGQPTGFNVDIFRAVCEALKIKYQINLDSWDTVRKHLENGEIDVITGMYFSPERDKRVDFSTPHIIVSHSLFVHKNSNIKTLEDLSGKEVLVQQGDIMHDFLQSQGRSLAIIPVPDQVDTLKLLSEGKHNCALISKLQGLYLIHKYKLDNIEVVGTSVQQRDYCFAVREGDQKLLSQLNEGLAIINNNGIYRQIHNKWFGLYEDNELSKDFLKYLLWAAIPILFLFSSIVIWNRMLRKHVLTATIALSRRENIYKDFVELAVDGIVLGSPEGRIIEANQVLCELLQLPHEELIGKHISQLPWASEVLSKTPLRFDLLNSGEIITRMRKLERKDGSKLYIEMRSRRMPDGWYQSIFRDITERINAENEKEKLMSELAQSQKMEAVGRLAGGIAHDFNNMLGVIIGYADMAMLDIDSASPVYKQFQSIHKAANRSAELTRQLLAFARKQPILPKIVDLNLSIESMLDMLQRLMGETVELIFFPSKEELWNVKMDPSQIDQILVNLCVNARDAIKDMGRVIIETKNITISEEYSALHKEFFSGKYVLLTVNDNGCGMDKEIINHIFEPFYTTKDIGHGTGLGLATVYGIVKQNNGFINVYSELGKGTIFRIYIPQA